MKTLTGKLEFISLIHSIKLINENSIIDLREYFFDIFSKLNDKKSKMEYTKDSIEFLIDDTSEYILKYENDNKGLLILMQKIEGFGWSNVIYYLSSILEKLNGRQIIVNLNEYSIKIEPDNKENVYGLYYTNNNSCKIDDNKVKETCKPNTNDCCIFLTVSNDGFTCEKFNSPIARMLLDRYDKKQIRANRIGNCKILGRKETEK